MRKLGILTHQIYNNQQYSVIANNLNKISTDYVDIDCILFHNDLGKSQFINNFPIMQSVEALDYDGTLIAVDAISAHILQKCLCAKEKLFYIWDISWHLNLRPLSFIEQTYLNTDIELIARSKDHANLISRIFRKPKHIIEEFDYEQLVKTIYS